MRPISTFTRKATAAANGIERFDPFDADSAARLFAALRARGVLYAPDYAINAGGIIDVCAERLGEDAASVRGRVERIGLTLARIFERAEAEGLPTHVIADRLAEERLYG